MVAVYLSFYVAAHSGTGWRLSFLRWVPYRFFDGYLARKFDACRFRAHVRPNRRQADGADMPRHADQCGRYNAAHCRPPDYHRARDIGVGFARVFERARGYAAGFNLGEI